MIFLFKILYEGVHRNLDFLKCWRLLEMSLKRQDNHVIYKVKGSKKEWSIWIKDLDILDKISIIHYKFSKIILLSLVEVLRSLTPKVLSLSSSKDIQNCHCCCIGPWKQNTRRKMRPLQSIEMQLKSLVFAPTST